MSDLTLLCWRDIPAQIIVGKGRKAIKIQLSDKFEKAIDRCAMKANLKDTDSYLGDWKKLVFKHSESTDKEAAEKESGRLEQKFDAKTLKAYVDNDGWTPMQFK
jgi:hypothetical protein